MDSEPARQVQCPRCRASFCIPSIDPERRARAVAIVRANTPLHAVRLLKDSGAIDLAAAKAIALHLTRAKGICHRCRKSIPPDEESICGNCHALNLNW